jgi:DNA-binding phage protein
MTTDRHQVRPLVDALTLAQADDPAWATAADHVRARRVLADALDARRADRGVTLTDLARDMSTSRYHLRRVLRGADDARLSTWQRIADATGAELVLTIRPRPAGPTTA